MRNLQIMNFPSFLLFVPLALLLQKDADRYYCDRYSGMHGGYEATKLATYPFLQEVCVHLYMYSLELANYDFYVGVYQ